jgi:hypothetical protein
MRRQVDLVLRGAGGVGENQADFGTSHGPRAIKSEIVPFFCRRNEIRLLQFSCRRA